MSRLLCSVSLHTGKTVVVKYGGAAMVDTTLKESFARDVALLRTTGIKVIIVHGGGRDITDMAKRLGIESAFIHGQRSTDRPMRDVVQMILAGKNNKDIVALMNRWDVNACGLSGVDARLFDVEKFPQNGHDLGFVGRIVGVNTEFLQLMLRSGVVPVIAPLGSDRNGVIYNINADNAAAAVGIAMECSMLIYLSDVEGIYAGDRLLRTLGIDEAERLIEQGIINHGMIPKVRSAIEALKAGVGSVRIMDGRMQCSLLSAFGSDEIVGTELERHHEVEEF